MTAATEERRDHSEAPVILRLDNVHSYYGNIHALKGISLTVADGEIVTLIGSNGIARSLYPFQAIEFCFGQYGSMTS